MSIRYCDECGKGVKTYEDELRLEVKRLSSLRDIDAKTIQEVCQRSAQFAAERDAALKAGLWSEEAVAKARAERDRLAALVAKAEATRHHHAPGVISTHTTWLAPEIMAKKARAAVAELEAPEHSKL